VVSFFLVACPVALDGCTDTISPEGCRFQHPERQYAVARLEDGLTVIKWDESGCSFAVCSAQTPAELVDLADSVSVAAGPPLPPNALARLPHPRVWPPTGAAFGLPVAALSLARRSDSRPWGPNRDRKGASIGSEPLP
jgi:hypothetical protein